MPLLFFAAVCFSISYIFWGQLARFGERYYPVWLMFLVLGAVAALGGTVAALVPADETAELPADTDEFVVIPRARWNEVTHELEDLRGLVKNVRPEDLVKEAMEEPAELPPVNAEMTGVSALRSVSQRTRALDLALTARTPAVEAESTVPVQEPAPIAVPALVVPPPAGRTAPEKSSVEREVDVFRTAYVTGIQRNPGEGPEGYISRASMVYASAASKPEPIDVARSTCAAVLETYRQLTTRQMQEFSKIVDFDLGKLVQVTKVVRNADEPLPEYVTRVRSILEAVAQTDVERLPPAKELAGLEFSLALFRGFLENYLSRPYVDQVVAEVEQGATTGEGGTQPATPKGDELSTYSRLVKNSLKPLVGKVIGEAEMASMIREMDAFVEDVRTPAPPQAAALTPAERKKTATERVEGIFEAVPGMARMGSKPTLAEKMNATQAVRLSFVPHAGFARMQSRPATPDLDRNSVSWESEAFSAACTTGIERQVNEDPGTYVRRAIGVSSERGALPGPTEISQAVSSTLVEAHRGLSETQMLDLALAIGWNVEKVLTDAGIPKAAGESVMEYVLRARSTLVTGARAEPTRALLGKEASALRWSLAFFKGILDGYLGPKVAGDVVDSVKKDATTAGSPPLRQGTGSEDLRTYSNLVKNALKPLAGGVVKQEDMEALIREIDTVVKEVSESSSPAPSNSAEKARQSTKGMKEKLDRLIEQISDDYKED